MWLLFHSNTKTRAVKDGERFEETCPSCKEHATFIEVEIEDNVGVWFVDVVGDKRRAFRCTSCTGTFDLKEEPVRALPKERAQIASESPKRREARRIASEIEDELAAIKARLGR